MNQIFVLMKITVDEGSSIRKKKILFTYRTDHGNIKKAFFNHLRDAENALNNYIKDPTIEIIPIGEEL